MHSAHLAAIHKISQLLTAHLELETLLPAFARLVQEHFSLDHVSVYQFNGTDRLELRALTDPDPNSKAPDDFQLGEPSPICVAFAESLTCLREVKASEKSLKGALHPGARLQLCIPYAYDKGCLGIINLESLQEGSLDAEDVAALEALGDSLATAARNAGLYASVTRKAKVLLSLNRLSQAINAERDLNLLLELIYQHVTQLVPCEHFLVALLEKESGRLEVEFEAVDGRREVVPSHLSSDVLVRRCLESRAPLLLRDDYARVYEEANGFSPVRPVKLWLAIPLFEEDRCLGLLILKNYRHPDKFSEDDLDFLWTIASQAAIAIRNTRLLREAEERSARLLAVNEVTAAATLTLNTDQLFQQVVEHLKKVIRFEKISLAVYQPETDSFLMLNVYVEDQELSLYKGMQIPAADTVMRIARETRKPFYTPVMDEVEPLISPQLITQGIQAAVSIPIVAEDVCLGTLNLGSQQRNGFSTEQIDFLVTVANSLGTALRNAHLYSQLEKSYADLKNAQEQLVRSEKLRAMGEMSVGVAHDFNNLLTAILGRTQILKKKIQSPEVLQGLEMIEYAALEGASTVRRLQEFTLQRSDCDFEAVDPVQLLEETLALTRTHWKDHAQMDGVKYTIEKHLEAVAPVAGNPSDLREVFMNILLNAFEAMPDGGVLRIEIRPGRDNQVDFSVRDNGIGMDEEVRIRVFDPFFTTKTGEGKGLGMSVAYGIVSRHHGHIEIESQPGLGTSVHLRLPVHSGNPVSKAPSRIVSPLPARETGRHSFLIVDDETPIREVLEEVLKGEGHQVYSASNGRVGVEIFDRHQPDFVITDLGMPEMSGWEVAAQVKSAQPGTQVLMITGWGVNLDEGKARSAGVDRILAKPFQIGEFQEVIHEMLTMGN
jgi:signal transduction histidine kinase